MAVAAVAYLKISGRKVVQLAAGCGFRAAAVVRRAISAADNAGWLPLQSPSLYVGG